MTHPQLAAEERDQLHKGGINNELHPKMCLQVPAKKKQSKSTGFHSRAHSSQPPARNPLSNQSTRFPQHAMLSFASSHNLLTPLTSIHSSLLYYQSFHWIEDLRA
ncbi:hypothetical protein O6H91_04G076800 [Diphasiastrum complanatum]|uniref:Uncharacterized protein n=1 Tax=Diphasiastrum complanatum TaxID=34168 RepID=A0ACC2DYM8_DIPCM|nr:hypothetical protein O6H91_04G076800 [Diphasiastrum complanatum]